MSANPYTYIGICNDVLEHMGEVALSTSNFDTARSIQKRVKNSVNHAISDIYKSGDQKWPWRWTEGTITMVAGTREYSLDANAVEVDWDSFYIERDASLAQPDAQEMEYMTWNEYVDRGIRENDENVTGADEYNKPDIVVRLKRRGQLVVSPTPDAAYTLKYPYYSVYTRLVDADDGPAVPESFREMIFWRTLYYMYLSRTDETAVNRADEQYQDWLDHMLATYFMIDDTMRYE